MALKFDRIGNKIVVTDIETSIEYEGRADEVDIKEYPTIDSTYKVEGIDGITNLVGYPIPFTEMRDKSGAVFANEDAWKAWYRENTSDFNNGGDSGEVGAVILSVSGSDATNTLSQKSGPSWVVSASTSPSSGQFILNTGLAQYTQEGNKRYYSLSFYIDGDSPIAFEVQDAQDVVSVAGVGSPLGAGDFANRAVILRKTGVNEVTLDRDNDNNVDMRVDVTFTAIM